MSWNYLDPARLIGFYLANKVYFLSFVYVLVEVSFNT